MESFRINDPILKHSIFTWNIINSLLCLTKTRYSTRSPVFSFAGSTWYLVLGVQHNDVEACISVCLCRRDGKEDEPPFQIETRFSLSLKTPTRMIAEEPDCKNTFGNGNAFKLISHRTTMEELCAALGNENCEETLVVVCDIVAVAGCCSRLLSADKLYLSEDLLKMFDRGEEADARLSLSQGKTVPVHKEILSSRSPVFKEKFQPNVSELTVRFAADVVEAMLRYIYSGLVEKIIKDDIPPSPKLYLCAVEYRIVDLMELLLPKKIYASTILKCRMKENIAIVFPHFVKSLGTLTGLSRVLLKNITLHNVVEGGMFCSLDRGNCNVSFEMEFRHMENPDQRAACLYGRYYFFDRFGQVRFTTRNVSSFDFEGKLHFRFDIEAEKLFGSENVIFPNDALTMQCQFKLGLPYETCISDPECVDYNLPGLVEDSQMLSLDRSMIYLLDSELFANVQLDVELEGRRINMSVHKSIMSVRSPVFLKLLQQKKKHHELKLRVKDFKALVSYIYTGSFYNRNVHLDLLYKAAEEYSLLGLKNKCTSITELCPLNHRNVLWICHFAIISENTRLKEHCLTFIRSNGDIIVGTRNWRRFTTRHPVLAQEILTSINQNV